MRKLAKRIIVAVLAMACILSMGESVQAATPVKVTSATFKVAKGGDFVKNVSVATVTFKVNKKSKVTVSILNNANSTVYKKTYNSCGANKTYSFNWNGKKSSGKFVPAGRYYVKVTAGKSKKNSGSLYFYTNTGFAGGNGSKANPYKVANEKQLKNVAKFNGKNFVQTKDIDFKGNSFTPLFSADSPFSGVYDGKNKRIKNITITGDNDYVGLFRGVGIKGTVKNLIFDGCSYSGHDYIGILTSYNQGIVSDCKVTNSTISSSSYTSGNVVGWNKGKVINCSSKSNLLNNYRNIGGIVGYNDAGGYISNCKSTDDIISASSYHRGGIAGYNGGTIVDCTVTNPTIAGTNATGGIAGRNDSLIKNCTVNDENGGIANGYRCGGIFGYGQNSGMQVGCTYYGTLNYIGN